MHAIRPVVVAVVLAVLVGCDDTHVTPTGGNQPQHSAAPVGYNDDTPVTPATATEPVITVEERPTMIRVTSKQSGKTIIPGVDIFADGRCVIRTFRGEENERKLQPSDVRGLLDYFDRQGLFSISDESIKRAITDHYFGQGGGAIDANHTRIAVRTATIQMEVSRNALDREIERYPAVGELRKIQNCVDKVYEIAGKIR